MEWILTKLVKLRRCLLRSLSVLAFSAPSGSKQLPGQHVRISECRHSVLSERRGTSFSPHGTVLWSLLGSGLNTGRASYTTLVSLLGWMMLHIVSPIKDFLSSIGKFF